MNKSGRLRIVKGDITEATTDVIVNAANSELRHGGGVARAIANAAGSALVEESNQKDHVPTGEVTTTTGGNLNASYVIHAVGPVWEDGDNNEEELLRRCITNSLEEAGRLQVQSIAFPAISTGIYGFPLKKAAKIMLDEANRYLIEEDTILEEVQFVLFTESDYNTFEDIYSKL